MKKGRKEIISHNQTRQIICFLSPKKSLAYCGQVRIEILTYTQNCKSCVKKIEELFFTRSKHSKEL